jgi:hypothetical protein
MCYELLKFGLEYTFDCDTPLLYCMQDKNNDTT